MNFFFELSQPPHKLNQNKSLYILFSQCDSPMEVKIIITIFGPSQPPCKLNQNRSVS
jgi:hypothetical protein